MVRPIKFRAWDKATKKILYSIPLYSEEAFDVLDFTSYLEYEVMQYTGLKDKNGNPIYEGDIIEVNWLDERYPKHIIGPVEWNENDACWELGEGGSPKRDAENYMVVIGNIYSNPELLN